IAAFTMALAGWQEMSAHSTESPVIRAPNVVPALFLLSSLVIIVYASAQHGMQLGVVLAGVTLVIAIGRSGYGFRQLRALAESRREARTDDLTGLPNRRLFFERLAVCLRPSPAPSRLAVLMIDLDRFKEINDSI